MEDPTTADTPIDSVVIRFSAISSVVEYEPAQMKSVDLSKDNYLFVTTPPLQADKAYDVSLSINGQDFWPYNTTSDDECFATQVGLEKTLRGKCISCDDDADCTSKCSGSVAPQGSHTPLSSCDRCCIHEGVFYAYSNFELAYADGAASHSQFSSGKSIIVESDEDDATFTGGLQEYVDVKFIGATTPPKERTSIQIWFVVFGTLRVTLTTVPASRGATTRRHFGLIEWPLWILVLEQR